MIGLQMELILFSWKRFKRNCPSNKGLWKGDYTGEGEHWSFPKTTSSPKPQQSPNPPIWIAARDQNSHDFAVKEGCNVQVTPLWLGDEEVSH